MRSSGKPSLLMLGAPPRAGNHLLRGLLDHHPQLLLPPDEDYFVRHLSRHRLLRWRGMLSSNQHIAAFSRELQKDGHLERINEGDATEVFGSAGSLDLDAYYAHMEKYHQRGDLDNLVRVHVEAMAAALGHSEGDGRLRVLFCALQSNNRDLTRVSQLLARSYDLRGIFLVRDPRAHLASKLVRNPSLNINRFCRRQNSYWQEIDAFSAQFGPALRLRFEELVSNTESSMRQVCEFAGIEFSASVLEYTQGGVTSRANSSFSVSPGIDPSVLTRYREILPPETVARLRERCLPQLFWSEPVTEAERAQQLAN